MTSTSVRSQHFCGYFLNACVKIESVILKKTLIHIFKVSDKREWFWNLQFTTHLKVISITICACWWNTDTCAMVGCWYVTYLWLDLTQRSLNAQCVHKVMVRLGQAEGTCSRWHTRARVQANKTWDNRVIIQSHSPQLYVFTCQNCEHMEVRD